MQSRRPFEALALVLTGVITHAALTEKLQRDETPSEQGLEQSGIDYREPVKQFLLSCERNQVVRTQQDVERFSTFGGDPVPDAYVSAFHKFIN